MYRSDFTSLTPVDTVAYGESRAKERAWSLAVMATGTGPPHLAALADQCTDELGENDMRVVFKALHSVAEKYKFLGVEMNIKMSEIKKIQSQCSDPGECLLEVLSVRLKQIPSLTWRDIDTALRSDTVGEPQLADRIRRQYGHLYSHDLSFEASLDQEPGKNMSEMTKSKKKAKKEKSARKYTQQESNEEVSEPERYRKPSKKNDNEAVVTKNQQKAKKYLHRKRHSKLGKQYIEKESKCEGKTQRKRKVTTYDNESEVLCGRQDRYYKVKHSEQRAQKEVKIESESESSASSSEQEIIQSDNSDSTEESYSSKQEEDSAEEVSETERYQKQLREDEYPHSHREKPVIRAKGKSRKYTTLLPKQKSKMFGSESKPKEDAKQKKKAIDQSGSMLMQNEMASDVDDKGESVKCEMTSVTHDTRGVGIKKHKRCRKRTQKKKKSEFGTSSEEEPSSSTFHNVEREKQVLEYPRRKETQKGYEVASATEHHKQRTRVPTESDNSASGSEEEQRQTPEPKRKTITVMIYSAESNEEEGETQLGVKTKASYRQYKLSEAEFVQRAGRKRKLPIKHRQTLKHIKLQQYSAAGGEESLSPQSDTDISVDKSPTVAKEPNSDTGDIEEKHTLVVKAGRKKRFHNNSPPANPFSYPQSQSGTQSNSECKGKEKKHQRHLKRVKRRKKMKQELESSSSSETDDNSSSPESDMLRNLTESENKGLIKAFKRCFGKLCLAIKDPDRAAAELQARHLLSCSTIKNLFTSPESQIEKAITLIRVLKKRIKSRPVRVFSIIEVFLRNEVLKEAGRELLNETGMQPPFTK